MAKLLVCCVCFAEMPALCGSTQQLVCVSRQSCKLGSRSWETCKSAWVTLLTCMMMHTGSLFCGSWFYAAAAVRMRLTGAKDAVAARN